MACHHMVLTPAERPRGLKLADLGNAAEKVGGVLTPAERPRGLKRSLIAATESRGKIVLTPAERPRGLKLGHRGSMTVTVARFLPLPKGLGD